VQAPGWRRNPIYSPPHIGGIEVAKDEHVAAFMKGSDYLRAWRANHPGQILDLSGADLSDAPAHPRLFGIDLSSADLRGANLREVWLERANFEGAKLGGADFSLAQLSESSFKRAGGEVVFRGAIMKQADLSEAHLEGSDFEQADLQGCVLSDGHFERCAFDRAHLGNATALRIFAMGASFQGAQLPAADLTGARLHGTVMAECDLSGVKLGGADLSHTICHNSKLDGASLAGADLRSAQFSESSMTHCVLNDCDARDVVLNAAILSRASFSRSNLQGAVLRSCKAQDVVMDRCDLREADFDGAYMPGSNLTRADLSRAWLGRTTLSNAHVPRARLVEAHIEGASFHRATLDDADLRGITFDSQTQFDVATNHRCRVDRYTVEAFADTIVWRKIQTRMSLRIEDGVAKLRSSFSGFWQWVHLIALTVFVLPYVFFLLRYWPFARAARPPGAREGDWVRVGVALCHYIRTGGEAVRAAAPTDRVALTLFVVLLAYNLARFVLLLKTKSVELYEITSSLPARFSLRDRVLPLPPNFKLPKAPIGVDLSPIRHRLWRVLLRLRNWRTLFPMTWGRVYWLSHYGFRVNVLVVLTHTVIYLRHFVRIPA